MGKENWVVPLMSAWLFLVSAGCSVAMALHGPPEPDFKAFEVGSSRDSVEIQMGKPVLSQTLNNGKKRDTCRYEVGNSPNGHRALMNLYIDLATLGIWEIPGTIVEATMGETKETSIIYSNSDRVVTIEGYVPPEPSEAHKAANRAQEQHVPQKSSSD